MNKVIVILVVLFGGYSYLSKHYKFEDTLTWSKNNPGSKYSDDVDYYVGMVYYQRAEYPKAQEAFTQLLQNHATSTPHIGPALVRLEDAAEGNHDWETARMALDKYFEMRDEYFPKDKHKELMEKRAEGLKMRGK